MWRVEYTDEFGLWWERCSLEEQERIAAAVELLEELGPSLGRPIVDAVKGSRHSNMKELRPPGGFLRVLFAFDPRRTAILLFGGDKRGRWSAWYDAAVPVADRLYDVHLSVLADEGAIDG